MNRSLELSDRIYPNRLSVASPTKRQRSYFKDPVVLFPLPNINYVKIKAW
jgi:hypothetical protein